MPTMLGSLRRLLMTPSLAEVSFARRRFPVHESAATRRLEAIPQAVVCGFEWGIDTRDQWELERRLDLVEPEQLGFAVEGATMACTILDAMGPGRGKRTAQLLQGPGERHIFLAYIGIGFAMSHLPKPLWKKVLPDLPPSPYHPTMSWLAVDGYGFDRAYFDTRRWVDQQFVPRPYPWQSCPDYFQRAIDQGIGRALWFINGAVPQAVGAAVERFAPARQADLWSGVGLAATVAGGCPSEGLATLRHTAGKHRAQLALGTVFAAKARTYTGFVPAHTEYAVSALGDLSIDQAIKLADETAVHESDSPTVPAYELWRHNIRTHFNSLTRTEVG
jgi:enediyne biosynthesis protein E2